MRPNPQFPADLAAATEEILNGKLHFLCSVSHLFQVHSKHKRYNNCFYSCCFVYFASNIWNSQTRKKLQILDTSIDWRKLLIYTEGVLNWVINISPLTFPLWKGNLAQFLVIYSFKKATESFKYTNFKIVFLSTIGACRH